MQKTILITGASSGIGRLTARLFAEQGWQVAATMRKLEKAGVLADLDNVHLFELDVSDFASVQQAVAACVTQLGQIDVVVNNAGFGVYGPVELAKPEEIDRQYDVNVKGVIRVMQAVLPHFRQRGEGLFIQISSIAGLLSYPLGALYNSSKWALEGLTEGMYFELRPLGVRVKLVEPGGFATNFQQVGLVWTEHAEISDYQGMIAQVKARRTAAQPNLPDPIAVAEKILEAALDEGERLRYLVGDDAEKMAARRAEIGAEAFIQEMYQSVKAKE
ncbi:MAG: SDR family oxidoreductase [Bacteroidota bacterium]